MKGIRKSVPAALRAAALAALATLPATAAGAAEIFYGSYLSPAHGNNKHGLLSFFAEAERLSDGALTFEFVPGGAVVQAKTSLEAVRDGVVDGAIVVALYYRSELPYNAVITDLGAFGEDAAVMAGATNETTLLDCPGCLAEWERHNLKHFGAYSTSDYKIICAQPVTAVEDLEGLRIRAAGAMGRWVNALGAVPVNVPVTDVYEGLQRGQIDCSVGSLSWLKTFSLWDVAKHVLDLPSGAYFGGSLVNLNLDRWNALTPAEREAYAGAAAAGVAGAVVRGYLGDDEETAAQLAQKGVEVVASDPQAQEILEAHRAQEVERVIETARQNGVEDPEAIAEAFLRNLEKWRGIVAEIGHDPERYEEALRREIYDRVTF